MEKLLLIDGSSVLSRNFYGSLPWQYKQAKSDEERERALKEVMKSKDGQYTNGVYSTMKFILKVLKEQKPTHMVIAWDISRNTFRKDIYPEYKGTRGKTPEALKSQFALMQDVLDACGLYQEKLERYEADDIIGTFAKKFEKEIPTYIITGDQDSLQLVTEDTHVWLTMNKADELYEKRNVDWRNLNIPDKTFEFTPCTFEEEYKLKPIQIIDMKALEGDSSDNIPGVKGVGPTASIPLLREYGTIEDIYKAIESTPEADLKSYFKNNLGIKRSPIGNLTKKATAENPLAGKDAAFLSKKLATIVTDIAEYDSVTLEDLRIKINQPEMEKAFQSLGFNSLL